MGLTEQPFVPSQDLINDFERYNPLTYLIESATATDIDDVYQIIQHNVIDNEKPTVFVVIGPSGAGKDTLVDYLVAKGLVRKVTTATSRPRRINENEPEDSYVWMRPKHDDETEEEYFANLVMEYELIEYDGHNGRLYGLPKQSLKSDSKRPSVIRTENKGLQTIQQKLGDEFNIVSIFIIPDSFETLLNRINGRENVELRIKKAVEEVAEAKSLVNYVVLNRDEPEGSFISEDKALRAKIHLHKLLISIVGFNFEA